jgi:hypothetical protein
MSRSGIQEAIKKKGGYILLTQPVLVKEQHHAPKTTNHAAAPPSGGPASSDFMVSPGIGPLASSGSRSVSPLRSESGFIAFSGSVFKSYMEVVPSVFSVVVAMVNDKLDGPKQLW